tara:strand:+ start:287 stop:658 length:372 start_codon:yes stop_codon:yes gene_type:complete
MRTLRVHISSPNMQKVQGFKESLQGSWLTLFNSNITTSDILRALLMLGLELLNSSENYTHNNYVITKMLNAPLWIHDTVEQRASYFTLSKTKIVQEAIHRACMHCDTPKTLLRALIDNHREIY